MSSMLIPPAASTQGIFRIPGAVRIVNALYDYYCYAGADVEEIAGTIRCANLPMHIDASVHDVASTFKKFLAALPGGILGSLSVFDAFVAIHSQLQGEPELNRTKQSKVRARLIALAIGTVRSQYRRELICAVFGLLSLIGREAETAPREDDQGRPLPTTDLMGYNALGIVFGPLLVGELLGSYSMRLASPHSGLLVLPLTPPKSRKEKIKKSDKPGDHTPSPLTFDKVRIANCITEMLVTHWREVIKHMKSLAIVRSRRDRPIEELMSQQNYLPQSASESFVIRKPKHWETQRSSYYGINWSASPTPNTPTPSFSKTITRVEYGLRAQLM
jgi:hypothetical protein